MICTKFLFPYLMDEMIHRDEINISGLCEYYNRHADDSFHNERDRSWRVKRHTLGSCDNVDPEEWHWNDWQYNVCMVEWVRGRQKEWIFSKNSCYIL